MIRTAILAFLVLIVAPGVLAEDPPSSAAALLPRDGVVDVMEPVLPERLEELARKLQQAVAKDPAWLQSHLATVKPGEPLPYHEKLGLTKAEYEEFQALSKKGGMRKVKSVKVKVEGTDDRVVLLFGESLPGLEKVEIDLKKDSASTPAGLAPERKAITASQDQSATGPWDGIQWRSKDFEQDTSRPSVSLAVGRLRDSQRGILYYRVKPFSANQGSAVQYVLFYDLPKAR